MAWWLNNKKDFLYFKTPVFLKNQSKVCPGYTYLLIMSSSSSVAAAAASVSAEEKELSSGSSGSCSKPLQCSYKSSSIFSKITVDWLTPLLQLGHKRPLQKEDLPLLDSDVTSQHLLNLLTDSLDQDSNKRSSSSSSSPPLSLPLWKAYYNVFGKTFIIAGLLKFFGDACALSTVFVLGKIISNMKLGHQSPEAYYHFYDLQIHRGILYCIALFLLTEGNSLLVNNYFSLTTQIGLKIRTSTNALIYQKSLRLSGRSRLQYSSGQIVNMMSTDTSKIESSITYVHYLWSGVFQALIILSLLFRKLSWCSLIGFAFLIAMIPFQSKLSQLLSQRRKEAAPLTDSRIKLMQEIIQGIRVIKFYAWEDSFLKKLFSIRDEELSKIREAQILRSLVIVVTSFSAIFSCIITFITYRAFEGPLSVVIISTSFAFFDQLRLILLLLPMIIALSVDGYVSYGRIATFLTAEELEFRPSFGETKGGGDEDSLIVENGNFEWDTEDAANGSNVDGDEKQMSEPQTPKAFSIKDVSLNVPMGSFVTIVGGVGSGKSSLLSALIGELKPTDLATGTGTTTKVSFPSSGSLAYCPQQAWIQNGTVKDNILFGAPYLEERYAQVLFACALLPDLEQMPDADMTEIGEKGVNLSGGQKQRISLARAAYSPSTATFLLDDPLSAVDADAGRHILLHLLKGPLMKGKLVLLVTHQLHILGDIFKDSERPGMVIVMKNGAIAEQGTMYDLLKDNDGSGGGIFCRMMKSVSHTPNPSTTTNASSAVGTEKIGDSTTESKQNGGLSLSPRSPTATSKKITSIEERRVGAVSMKVYYSYMKASGGLTFVFFSIGFVFLMQLLRTVTDQWINTTVSPKDERMPIIVSVVFRVIYYVFGTSDLSMASFNVVYIALGVFQILFGVVSSLSFCFGALRASKTVNEGAFISLLKAPILFFDTNPTGRILSRFSKDLDVLDTAITESMRSFFHCIANVIIVFMVILIAQYKFILPLIVLFGAFFGVYFFIQNYYLATSRELKRLEGLLRSPLYAHFSESLSGLSTIRAFRREDAFLAKTMCLADQHNQASFAQLSIQRWLGVRLESIGNLIVLSAALSFFLISFDSITFASLSLTYALRVTGTLNWVIRQAAELETQIISSERLQHYAEDLEIDYETVPIDGVDGLVNVVDDSVKMMVVDADADDNTTYLTEDIAAISFKNLHLRYRPELDSVLRGITVDIKRGERVGIVGRTGSGKSSIIQSLFRIINPHIGSISLFGRDTRSIPLPLLRSQISIIPQDPVIFEGTIRWNLDPSSKHADSDLLMVLERCHLLPAIIALSPGSPLDAKLLGDGDNLSVGQRQLLCLARALLRRNKVLVLDEATANIDFESDLLIQQMIRNDPLFKGVTILTIAHRLPTIMDYDKILLLDDGRVKEFGSPSTLLSQKGAFYSLVNGSGALLAVSDKAEAEEAEEHK